MSEYLNQHEMEMLLGSYEGLTDSDPCLASSWFKSFKGLLDKGLKELSQIPRHDSTFDPRNPRRLSSFDLDNIRGMARDCQAKGLTKFKFDMMADFDNRDNPSVEGKFQTISMDSNELILELVHEVSRLRHKIGAEE